MALLAAANSFELAYGRVVVIAAPVRRALQHSVAHRGGVLS